MQENSDSIENKSIPEENIFRQFFRNTREKLDNLEKSKSEIIKELAKNLETAGMPVHMICERITDELDGLVSSRHIRDVLDDKYKKVDNKKELVNRGGGSANDDKKEQEDIIEKPIEIATDGTPIEDEGFIVRGEIPVSKTKMEWKPPMQENEEQPENEITINWDKFRSDLRIALMNGGTGKLVVNRRKEVIEVRS